MPDKRILIFIDWYLPGYRAGGPVTSVANIVERFRNEFEFYILTTNRDYGADEPYPDVESNRWLQRNENEFVYYHSEEAYKGNSGGSQVNSDGAQNISGRSQSRPAGKMQAQSGVDRPQSRPAGTAHSACAAKVSGGAQIVQAKQLETEGPPSVKSVLQVARETGITTWYITGVYSLRFAIEPVMAARRDPSIRTIVAPRGMLSAHAFGVKPLKKKLFMAAARIFKLYRDTTFQSTNPQEHNDIARLFPRNEIILAPNLPKPVTLKEANPPKKMSGQLRLVSIGRISPEKNTLYALEVLEKLARDGHLPPGQTLSLELYGQIHDAEYWVRCEDAKRRIQNMTQPQSATQAPAFTITHHGTTPNPAGPISNAHFLFLPTNGENYGHAIVESWGNGRPVIISDRTPWHNLENKGVGFDLSLDNPGAFVNVIAACMNMDQKEYDEMCRKALDFAHEISDNPEAAEAHRKLFT